MEETHDIVEIQRNAWGMDDLGIVPTFETKAVASVGTVLIAKNDEGKGIGFIYAYDQIPDIHYSHMMAILPEYQGQGIGYALKMKHYQIAKEKGINHIKWTVDPLLPNNAYLNFAKLGGVCNTYYVDYYGAPDVEGITIYAGLPTDRFLLDWQIQTDKVNQRLNNFTKSRISEESLLQRSPVINKIEDNRVINIKHNITGSFSVEIPSNFQYIRENKLEIAIEWRIYFREICLKYFAQGYSVVDYFSYNREKNYYEFDLMN